MICRFSVPAVIRKRATRKAHIDENNNEKNEAVVATAFLELISVGDSNAVEFNIAFDPQPIGPITEHSPASHIVLLKLLNLANTADFMKVGDDLTEVIDANTETVH